MIKQLLKHILMLVGIGFTTLCMAQKNEVSIDNGVIKVKIDLNSGGAISYLSASGSNYNVVNTFDKGRFIQQSYYTGNLVDRSAEGQHTTATFSPWNWNPIQGGDVFGNRSQVLTYNRSGNQLYVKTLPKLWDMNNESCQCHFETWITLSGTVAHVRNRLTNFRTDNIWDAKPHHQELPAVYSIGDLYKLYTYTGNAPFTNGSLSRITSNGSNWSYWNSPEKWAALVNSNNWGMGVYNPISTFFIGGFAGARNSGGTNNDPTGYFAPLITKAMGKNEVYEYQYTLILGNLSDIRAYAYHQQGVTPGGNAITWGFNSNGNTEGWTRGGGANSVFTSGGELRVNIGGGDPQIIRTGLSIDPRQYGYLKVGLRNLANDGNLEVFWGNASGGFSASKRATLSVAHNNNSVREYVFALKDLSLWRNGALPV